MTMTDPSTTPPPARGDLRGVLIAVIGGRLLLPNTSVAEVITFADPEPLENAPSWLLGRVRWQGWRLPLLSFSRLAGWGVERGELGAKVAVLKLLGGNPRLPYLALLTQGFPRLTTVPAAQLKTIDDGRPLPLGVRHAVVLSEDPAAVPDLDSIEALLAEALAQAA